MLPTENENQGIYLSPVASINKIHYWDKRISNSYIAQDLYILSDDKIKEDDHCLNLETNTIFKMHKHGLPASDRNKKIIATTDTSLYELKIINGGTPFQNLDRFPLPQPSQQFIEKYIEEYNKGNIITDVLVEYETYQDTINYHKDIWKNFERIKTNPKDNSITIKKLKDNWNREEIVEFGEKIREYCKNGYKSGSLHKVFYEWDKWIEENL